MSEFKIEKGIPIPIENYHDGHSKYPFKKMEIGDSFYIKCKNKKDVRAKQSAVGSRVRAIKKKGLLEGKFTARCVISSNGKVGVRVWRTK